jgi:hypothetical protein
MPLEHKKLQTTIQRELSRMLVRGIPYSPAAEDLPAVTRMMMDDLMRLGLTDADCGRVEKAFQFLALHSDRWPTAYMVRANLPKQNDHFYQALPAPRDPVKARQHIESMKEILANQKGVPPC